MALGKSAGKRALCKALGVLCSQIWGGGRAGPRQRAAQTLTLPQAELEGPEGPSLAAEKHGGAERKEGRGRGMQSPTGPPRRRF